MTSHRQTQKGNPTAFHQPKNGMLYGRGCKYHPDCFTCLFPDCKVTTNLYYSQHKDTRQRERKAK